MLKKLFNYLNNIKYIKNVKSILCILGVSLILICLMIVNPTHWGIPNTIYWILLFIMFAIIVVLIIYVYILKTTEIFRDEPATLFFSIVAVLIITTPILFSMYDNQNVSSIWVSSFFSVTIGIGINYVIDSIFKMVVLEIEGNDENKNLVKKKHEVVRFLFNLIYFTEYATFLILEKIKLTSFDCLKECNIYIILKSLYDLEYVYKMLILFIVLLLLLLGICFLIKKWIRVEFKNDTKNKNDILKNTKELSMTSEFKNINNEALSMISEIRNTINEELKMTSEIKNTINEALSMISEIKNTINEELSMTSEIKNTIKQTIEDNINGLIQCHKQLQKELKKLDTKK